MKSAQSFAKMKRAGAKIAAVTAYDASFAALVAAAGVDTVLVGDSVGMVVHGRPTTHGVGIDDIERHVSWVRRGAPDLHVMADLPFGSFEGGRRQAFATAARLLAAGAQMVKLEGGAAVAPTIEYLVERGVPVCAHVGLLPQSAHATGMRVQGRSAKGAERILADAAAVSAAGASLLVLEMIPAKLARKITAEVASATIGIGAGRDCDGQILVLYDMIGLYPKSPSFSKNFLAAAGEIDSAIEDYVAAVRAGNFPDARHTPA